MKLVSVMGKKRFTYTKISEALVGLQAASRTGYRRIKPNVVKAAISGTGQSGRLY
jgi:hypothetical protein